jgi:hypothetical protein
MDDQRLDGLEIIGIAMGIFISFVCAFLLLIFLLPIPP